MRNYFCILTSRTRRSVNRKINLADKFASGSSAGVLIKAWGSGRIGALSQDLAANLLAHSRIKIIYGTHIARHEQRTSGTDKEARSKFIKMPFSHSEWRFFSYFSHILDTYIYFFLSLLPRHVRPLNKCSWPGSKCLPDAIAIFVAWQYNQFLINCGNIALKAFCIFIFIQWCSN